jgi:uncharacterized membrane protein YvbJ
MGARFVCQNCGAEVRRDSKACPKCGRSFRKVLCPSCGFEGDERLFADGCPSCGYTSGKSGKGKSAAKAAQKPAKEAPQRSPAGALPAWAYILAVLAFAGILAMLLVTNQYS